MSVPIVKVIIRDMLWDAQDVEGEMHEKMMSSFRNLADVDEHLADEKVMIDSALESDIIFSLPLLLPTFRGGCSFRQAALLME